jgi:hypothetical protein
MKSIGCKYMCNFSVSQIIFQVFLSAENLGGFTGLNGVAKIAITNGHGEGGEILRCPRRLLPNTVVIINLVENVY